MDTYAALVILKTPDRAIVRQARHTACHLSMALSPDTIERPCTQIFNNSYIATRYFRITANLASPECVRREHYTTKRRVCRQLMA